MLEFEIPVLALALVSLRCKRSFLDWLGDSRGVYGPGDSNRDLAGVFLALVRCATDAPLRQEQRHKAAAT